MNKRPYQRKVDVQDAIDTRLSKGIQGVPKLDIHFV